MLDSMAPPARKLTGPLLAVVVVVYAALAWTGIDWGLPSRADDRYLFSGDPWPVEKINQGARARTDAAVGADVDASPLATSGEPAVLNATTSGVAEIVRRYRLFTRQPDEMITIMALSGMNPRALQLDPKLYQYGGLFVYPVGALIGMCGAAGVYPVEGNTSQYLARPEDIGKFYMTARAYAAAWGLLGVVVVFAVTRRIAGAGAGVLASGLYALLPVVTCMAHEAKPHLPGAVLMLAACLFAMRALDRQRARDWAGLFIGCGAAVGMVLSSAPIVLLVPLAIGLHCWNQTRRQRNEFPADSRRHVDYRPVFVRATLGGWLVAGAVYLVTNPYVVINLFVNRAVLRSNFGNSLAMYEVARVLEGAVRVADLTIAGATLPVALLGIAGGVWLVRSRTSTALPVAAIGVVVALQFVLIGAGKPDEYGRFGVFVDCALAIGCAVLIGTVWRRMRVLGVSLAVVAVGWCGAASAGYLASFRADAARCGTRDQAAAYLADRHACAAIALTAEPAPYGCPPLAFDAAPVVLYRLGPRENALDAVRRWNAGVLAGDGDAPRVLVTMLDDPQSDLAEIGEPAWKSAHLFAGHAGWLPRARISWANKPVVVLEAKAE